MVREARRLPMDVAVARDVARAAMGVAVAPRLPSLNFYGGFGFRVQGTVQSLGWLVLGLTKALQRFVLVGVSGFGFMASA